jgi:death on curing protein
LNYLEFADYLVIAEAVTGVPAEVLARLERIGLAESALLAPTAGFGGVEAYPDFETKAAPSSAGISSKEPPAAGWQQALRVPGARGVLRSERTNLESL